jgi:hypothetical protein
MPRRYLADDKRFQDFQRIRARIKPNFTDGRPESMRIDPDSIKPLDVIPSRNHAARRHFVERSTHLVRSVEELIERQGLDGMSLGAIRPKQIVGTYLKPRSAKDIAAWKQKEHELTSQQFMSGEPPPMKLDCPEVSFQVKWRCDDPRCMKPHDMGIKTWGIHELYRRYTREADPHRDEKVKAAMDRMFDLSSRDVFMFLGTFVDLRFEFGLMGALSVPREDQLSLL